MSASVMVAMGTGLPCAFFHIVSGCKEDGIRADVRNCKKLV